MRLKGSGLILNPLPGESLYSVMVREQSILGAGSDYFYNILLGGVRLRRNPERIPFFLFEEDPGLLRYLAAYYELSTLSPVEQERFLTKLFNQKRGEKLSFPYPDLNGDRSLFYCPECMDADRSTYGIPYFHTLHQISGIKACHKHGTALIPYKRPFGTPLYSEGIRGHPAKKHDREIAALLPGFRALNCTVLREGYRLIFKASGLTGSGAHRSIPDYGKIYSSLHDFYGEVFMRENGLILTPGDFKSPHCYLKKLLNNGRTHHNPAFIHLMIWNCFGLDRDFFIESMKRKITKDILDKKARVRPCQNVFCGGIMDLYSLTVNNHHLFKCPDCGMIIEADGSLKQCGELFMSELKKALKAGVSLDTLALRTGFKRERLRGILRGDPLRYEKFLEEKLTEARGYKSLKDLRRKNPNLYYLLIRPYGEKLEQLFGEDGV